MAQDQWTLQEKKKVKTGARAASCCSPCCSCQQDSLHNSQRRSWRTWNEQGGGKAKLNGANDEGSGHGMAKASRQANKPAEQGRCRRTQPADDLPGTGLEETTATDVGRPLTMQCSLVEGVRWCWPLKRWAQTYLTCLPPTFRLCLSLSIPTPLICTNPI